MTSIERIIEYTSLEKEPLENRKIKPPEDWPNNGIIKFQNVSFSYAKNLPNVLNNLNFETKKFEKIGKII